MLAALVLLVTIAACAGPEKRAATSPQVRAVLLHNIAASYAQTGDLTAAKTALNALKVANPAQLLISQAEDAVRQGAPSEEVQAYSDLAEALGMRSRIVVAYLEPTPTEDVPTQAPLPSVAEPTNTPVASPTASPTAAPVATQAPTSTPAPATSTSATTSAKPQVSARDNVNLRAGPGTNYPTVGQLKAGSALSIMGRNQSGDWWRVAYPSENQAWVSGVLVDVSGPIDTVAVVKNIPTLAPVPTPAPVAAATSAPVAVPTQPPAAPALPAGMQYVVKSVRLRPVGQGQVCGGGNHLLVATVIDAAGKPIDGVAVREVWTKTTHITGEKGPGGVEWVTGKGGGGQLVVVDGSGNPISSQTRGMSDDFPDFDLMQAAGYCACESLDDAACEQAIQSAQQGNVIKRFAQGHYVFEVVFQRAS